MNAAEISILVGFVTVALSVGAILVKLGRVLERQDVTTKRQEQHEAWIGELQDGHGEHNAAFESLRGEMMGLRTVMQSLAATMEKVAEKLDRHLER